VPGGIKACVMFGSSTCQSINLSKHLLLVEKMCKTNKVTKSAEKSSARKTENGNVVKQVAKLATPIKKLSTGSRNEKPPALPRRPVIAENVAEILEFPDPLVARRAQKNNYSTNVGRKGYSINKIAAGRSRGKWLFELLANEQIDASPR
jgi:hypothetical protein